MKHFLTGNSVEIQDTGAPRGERNYWEVKVNGVVIYGGHNGAAARRVFSRLCDALSPIKVAMQG